MKCHKIALTLNCTVAKPLKLPTIPFKTWNICQVGSLNAKNLKKNFWEHFQNIFWKSTIIGVVCIKYLWLRIVLWPLRKSYQLFHLRQERYAYLGPKDGNNYKKNSWEHFQNIFWQFANIDFFNYLLKIITICRFSKNILKMFQKIFFRFFCILGTWIGISLLS